MSIWSSIGDGELRALANDGDAANYRGEGTPDVMIDVATTSNHDLIRLATWNEDGSDREELLITTVAAIGLIGRLGQAMAIIEGRHG